MSNKGDTSMNNQIRQISNTISPTSRPSIYEPCMNGSISTVSYVDPTKSDGQWSQNATFYGMRDALVRKP